MKASVIFSGIAAIFLTNIVCAGQAVKIDSHIITRNIQPVQVHFMTPDTLSGDFTEVSPVDSVFVTSDSTDFWVVATASADYDNDGDLDIAVLGYYVLYNVSAEDRLILMRNDSLGGDGQWIFTYYEVPLDSLTAGSSDMAWGDADGDGDLDLAVGSDGITVIYRNDAGMLIQTDTQLPGYWEENSQAYFNLHSLSWADYDNDGDQDLLIPSVYNYETYSFRTSLMRNDGSNGSGGFIFTEIDSVFAPTMHAQSSWADYDADGDLDLLLVNIAPLYDEGFIRIYRNDGTGLFVGLDILGSLSIEHGEAQWGDYDGDGDLDILVSGNLKETDSTYTPMALRIYQNDNNNYTPLEVIPDPFSEGWWDFTAATWADYDSDGDVDILLAGNYNSGTEIEGRARIYYNEGNVFTDSGNELPAPHASGDRAGTFSWLDIDGDSDLDYFIAGEYFVPGGNGLVEAQMHLYRNDASGTNLAPDTPSGASINHEPDNSVRVSWLPAGDDHTPGNALTYDMTLFHDNIPVSLPERVPCPGNVSTSTEWSFIGLQPGNYAFTLCAVDASYTSGPAATGEFSVGITAVDENSAKLPEGYFLGQNFPNPASDFTSLTYAVPVDDHVSMKLFDMRGLEVMNLVDEMKKAGTYNLKINTIALPAGVYFYRLNSENFTSSRILIISESGNR